MLKRRCYFTTAGHGPAVDILRAMRRWIAIALMIVLPLQFSWAAVAAYCQDEQGSSAQHFGHHVHLQQKGDSDGHGGVSGSSHAKGQQQADRDCGCSDHLCGAHLLPSALSTIPSMTACEHRHASALRAYQSSDPPRIERPNWPVSA